MWLSMGCLCAVHLSALLQRELVGQYALMLHIHVHVHVHVYLATVIVIMLGNTVHVLSQHDGLQVESRHMYCRYTCSLVHSLL